MRLALSLLSASQPRYTSIVPLTSLEAILARTSSSLSLGSSWLLRLMSAVLPLRVRISIVSLPFFSPASALP